MTAGAGRALRSGLVLAALAVAGLTAGCTAPEPPHSPGAIAFVVGGRANMPRPQLNQEATTLLNASALSHDRLSIVGVDGDPQLLYQENLNSGCDSKVACDAFQADTRRRVNALVDAVRAKTAEADTLRAIALAARAVQQADGPGPKRIVIIDSGVQTAGGLRLQAPGALSVDPAAVAGQLHDTGLLPDLRGVDVLFTGLGTGYAPQRSLEGDNLVRLADLWEALLRAAGAGQVGIDTSPLTAVAPAAGLPTVSVVSFNESAPAMAQGCARIRFDQIGFRPDKAELRDPAAARQLLSAIAAQLTAAGTAATVVGTTAAPEAAPGNPLSLARATAVLELLVQLGVPRERLTAVGAGTNFPGFVPDTDASGQLIETLAAQNRLVIIQQTGAACGA